MKRLRKWSYLLLLAGTGILYMTFADGWDIYAESAEKMNNLYREAVSVLSGEPDSRLAFPGEILEENAPEQPDAGEAFQDGAVSEGQNPPAADGDGGTDGPEDQQAPQGQEIPVGDGGEPVYMTVEEDYFSDAVFIGDSRTVGLYEYGGLEDITTFYASTGLTVYKIFDSEIVQVPGQRKKISIEEALSQNEFRKIYLMIGINEMGTGTVETFAARYREVVDHLLELEPNAILYIQGIMKVSTERSGQGDYINNEGIQARNEAISQLADNRRVFYLDVNPLVCDETGGMEPSYSFDGVHLKAQYIGIWVDYLKSHAVQTSPGQVPLDDSFI